MKASTWQRIYQRLDDRQWEIIRQRRAEKSGTNPGPSIQHDVLAQQWWRLDRLKHRVGRHFCHARDREAGMKAQPWEPKVASRSDRA